MVPVPEFSEELTPYEGLAVMLVALLWWSCS
jgi:hypothetical protein